MRQTLNKISKVLKLNLKKNNSLSKKHYYVSNIYKRNLYANINSPPDIKLAYKWRKGHTDQEIYCFWIFCKKNIFEKNNNKFQPFTEVDICKRIKKIKAILKIDIELDCRLLSDKTILIKKNRIYC